MRGEAAAKERGGGAGADIPVGAGGPLGPSPLGFPAQRRDSEPVVCLLRLIRRGRPDESGVCKGTGAQQEVEQVPPEGSVPRAREPEPALPAPREIGSSIPSVLNAAPSLQPESPTLPLLAGLPLEKWEAHNPLCPRHSWWPKRAPGKCSSWALSAGKAWTSKPRVSRRAASNALLSREVWGSRQVLRDRRPLTPTLLYPDADEETEAQSGGVICPRSHTSQGLGSGES